MIKCGDPRKEVRGEKRGGDVGLFNAFENPFADQGLCRLWPPVYLAQEVGALLGRGPLVLGALSSKPPKPTPMTPSPPDQLTLPATRQEALERLAQFLPHGAADYARRRNFVEPGYGNVSRLSPALRTRVLLEREVCETVLERHAFPQVEKFIQEIYWRLYWKGWLEMRPAVWGHYREQLNQFSEADRERAAVLERGESGVAIMDHFARELVETGYLHNHARMWFASFWIHEARIPWELGADFFFRHLLDGDAASNTLSWRWVAGLHTRGKHYLVRRSNLERYCDPDLLAANSDGLDRLEKVSPRQPGESAFANPERQDFPIAALEPEALKGRWGLWIHDEDLSPEQSEIVASRPAGVRAFVPTQAGTARDYPDRKVEYLAQAMTDAADRAGRHFGCEAEVVPTASLAESVAEWAREAQLDTVVAASPFVGPLADGIEAIREALAKQDRRLVLFRRQEDAEVMPGATAGFFGFWKKSQRWGFIGGGR